MSDLAGYRIDAKLGEGGFATVYRAVQCSLDRPVAIKLLNTDLAERPDLRERFERESRLIARLSHPHIVQVIDSGVDAAGRPFYVMEYVRGVTLQQAMGTGALTPARKLDLALQLVEALAYAHKSGIVHRDIKPANILIDFEGRLRLADFGIALEGGCADALGELAGTASYMAPEQWLAGHPAAPASDIYAFGAVLCQLFTGQLPGADGIPPGAGLPAGMGPLLRACLQQKPEQRPAADELRLALRRIAAGGHLGEGTAQRAADSARLLGEQFQLLDVLREDEREAVFLFDDQRRQQPLVLRRLPHEPARLAVARQLMARSHPGIGRVLGCAGNERIGIVVQEYLSGGSLAQRLLRAWRPQDFLRVALPLVKALAYVHRLGLAHGDLRAENILFDAAGVAKLVDFRGVDAGAAGASRRAADNALVRAQRGDLRQLLSIFAAMLLGVGDSFSTGRLLCSGAFWRLPGRLRWALLRAAAPDAFGYASAESLLKAMGGLQRQLQAQKTALGPRRRGR